MPRYHGFRLRLTKRTDALSHFCHRYQCCIGCAIPNDDTPTTVGLACVGGFGTLRRCRNLQQMQNDSPKDPIVNQRSRRLRLRSLPYLSKPTFGGGIQGDKGGLQGAITLEDC
jgi:hypothetical protein